HGGSYRLRGILQMVTNSVLESTIFRAPMAPYGEPARCEEHGAEIVTGREINQ
ncbi:MAG: hypothetical protein H6Q34_799, partial [Deltaproteobacteria bacterium]|nr:hypothetical protein [Deltaproteobacteria bacterium]